MTSVLSENDSCRKNKIIAIGTVLYSNYSTYYISIIITIEQDILGHPVRIGVRIEPFDSSSIQQLLRTNRKGWAIISQEGQPHRAVATIIIPAISRRMINHRHTNRMETVSKEEG